MKRQIFIIAIIGILFALSSCEKVFMEPNPETNNKAIFNEYVKLVKEKYAMLEFKEVDIDQLAASIEPSIKDELSEKELFEKLGQITLALKDGHSDLSYGENYIGYDFLAGYPPSFDVDILVNNYTSKDLNPSLKVVYEGEGTDNPVALYGRLIQDNKIGYLLIPSWNVTITDEQIETIFSSFKDAKGLIIDIRENTGGDPDLAVKFASYLTDKAEVYTGFERFKTGPGKNDFTDSKIYLKQANSNFLFTKPVAVLTNRLCFSASTTFLYSINPLTNVTTIGQRTGGGSGSVADGFLANGWKWSLSTSEFIDHLDNHLDNGIDPDIAVALDTLDKTKDEIIERAILELQ